MFPPLATARRCAVDDLIFAPFAYAQRKSILIRPPCLFENNCMTVSVRIVHGPAPQPKTLDEDFLHRAHLELFNLLHKTPQGQRKSVHSSPPKTTREEELSISTKLQKVKYRSRYKGSLIADLTTDSILLCASGTVYLLLRHSLIVAASGSTRLSNYD